MGILSSAGLLVRTEAGTHSKPGHSYGINDGGWGSGEYIYIMIQEVEFYLMYNIFEDSIAIYIIAKYSNPPTKFNIHFSIEYVH